MDVRLDPRSQRLIEQQLRAGRYHSPEEVIVHALETLAERESPHWEEQEHRQAVQEMLEFAGKHRFTLGEGLHIRDLIHRPGGPSETTFPSMRAVWKFVEGLSN